MSGWGRGTTASHNSEHRQEPVWGPGAHAYGVHRKPGQGRRGQAVVSASTREDAQLSSVTLGARTGTEAGEGLAFRSPTCWALLHHHPCPVPPLPQPRLRSRVLLLQLGRAAPGVGCVFQTHRAACRNSHAQDRGFQTSTSVYNRQYMFHRDSPKRRSFILRITFMAEYFLLERFSGSVRMLGAHSLPSRVQVLSRAARYLGAGRC